MTEKSCLVNHFSQFQILSGSDIQLLETLEQDPVSFRKNAIVWREHDEQTCFYTIKSGWAYCYHNLEDGSRQVLDIFVPGNVIGLRDCAFQHRLATLATLTDAELCPFPQERLGLVFAESPRLANLFFVMSAADQAILLQRMISLGRRNALKRIAHFLVEICERLKLTACAPAQGDSIHLPFSQALIGDALGLSAVHVNRTCKVLKDRGLIGRRHHEIDVLDLDCMKELAEFDPSYLRHDLSLPLFGNSDDQGKACTGSR